MSGPSREEQLIYLQRLIAGQDPVADEDLPQRPVTTAVERAEYKQRAIAIAQRPYIADDYPPVRTFPHRLASEVWNFVLEGFADANIVTSRISQDGFQLLLPHGSNTDDELAIWAQLVAQRSPNVTQHQLARALRLKTTTSDDRDFEEGIAYYYIRNWTFTLPEIRSVILRLMAEDISYQVLRDWIHLSCMSETRDEHSHKFFTARYVGKVFGPNRPAIHWMENVNEWSTGLLFDFLRVTEIYYPDVNAACYVQTILYASKTYQPPFFFR